VNHGRHNCILSDINSKHCDCVNINRHNNCISNDINSKHGDCVNKGVINLLSLNVCGLIRRSQYPDFIELINKYEILCFVETKTDDPDEINLPGFDVIMKNRFKINRTKSGGIVLAFKKTFGRLYSST